MEKSLQPETFLKMLISFLEQTKSGLLLVDISQKNYPIVYSNNGFHFITGYSSEEIIGKNVDLLFADYLPKDSVEKIKDIVKNPKTVYIVTKFMKKNRELIDLSFSITPVINFQKGIDYVFLIFENISESKKLIEEKAATKVLRVVLGTINDIIYNYMNYIIEFRDDLSEVNTQLKNEGIEDLLEEYNLQFRKAFSSLTKFGDLSSFVGKILDEDFRILDIR